MTRLAIAIDLSRCTGCNTCAMACKMQNNVPMGMTWNRVLNENCEFEVGVQGTYPSISRSHLPIACQHCENPACLRVCPTGATYKDDKGRVEIDYEKCIGCRMCMAACPYNARVFNWNEPVRDPDFNYGDKDVPVRGKGVVEKCTLCKERTDRGDEPMCVRCCPFQGSHVRRPRRSGQRDLARRPRAQAGVLSRAGNPPASPLLQLRRRCEP